MDAETTIVDDAWRFVDLLRQGRELGSEIYEDIVGDLELTDGEQAELRDRIAAAGIRVAGEPSGEHETSQQSAKALDRALPSEAVHRLATGPCRFPVLDGGQTSSRSPHRHTLLDADEEVYLSRIVQDGAVAASAMEAGWAEAGSQEWERLREHVAAGKAARNLLVRYNVRLVARVAALHASTTGMESDDLLQEGIIGLIRAAELFDPERGCRFSTYATWWIRQSITRAVADKSRLIRLPVHVHERAVKVVRARDRLLVSTGTATAGQIADHLGMDPTFVMQMLWLVRGPASLDAPLGDGRATLGEQLAANHAAPTGTGDEDSELVRAALGTLESRLAEILSRRFGLDGGDRETLEAIGRDFGVTRERIRQLERTALKRLTSVPTIRELRPRQTKRATELVARRDEPTESSDRGPSER